MSVLSDKGVLHQYAKMAPIRGRHHQQSSTKPIAALDKASKTRSYSHSTVDEMSGDEETLVDGSMEFVPPRDDTNAVNGSKSI